MRIVGEHDDKTKEQLTNCMRNERAVDGALMADGHLGYAMPIGGVVAYDNAVSPNGVGYDIACGNKAVRLHLRADDIRSDMERIMDEVFAKVAFGVGSRTNRKDPFDHPLFEDDAWQYAEFHALKGLAAEQLGSVGAGNHYVDIFEDENGDVWVGVHFGSRGLGHKIATGFLNIAKTGKWDEKGKGESMMEDPAVLGLETDAGQFYWEGMQLAGKFAYAGRDFVCKQVADILHANIVEEVHNHHNYAWKENHNGRDVVVVRKGATPAFPGQRGFVGGSMGNNAVIVEGVTDFVLDDAYYQEDIMFSTVHGAGRVMSRRQAAGKTKWKRDPVTGKKRPERVEPGAVSREEMDKWVAEKGVVLRGADVDESPQVYRRLPDVLKYYTEPGTLKVVHTLRPMGVAMAGSDVYDPYKD